MAGRRLRAATRGSPLARHQTALVADRLGVEVEVVVVETTGDRLRTVPIHEMGGRGVFVKEVQQAVLDGRADFAVHSAKDLPSTPTPGLVMAAVPVRDDPRDCLVGTALAALGPGARVATGSVRRRAQLAALRPDLAFAQLRGNIGTRLERAAEFDAVVVAVAALRRLGREDAVAEVLETEVMVPQVAQGALAVECRPDDDHTRAALAALEDPVARRCVDAERAFLAAVGGACDLPVGALARVAADGRVTLRALLAAADGSAVLRTTATGDDPAAVGAAAARDLLVDQEGTRLLAATDHGRLAL